VLLYPESATRAIPLQSIQVSGTTSESPPQFALTTSTPQELKFGRYEVFAALLTGKAHNLLMLDTTLQRMGEDIMHSGTGNISW
jgi:hypothetical protein